jgi:hypothetical protein
MDANRKTQTKKKIDSSTIARQQLAARFKKTINASLFSSDEQEDGGTSASKTEAIEAIELTSETLATSEILTSETLATSKTLAAITPSFYGDETLVTSKTLVDETLVTSKTLVNFPYGEKIPDSLFLLVLDHGFYDLLKDQVSAAPILFYWVFTTQQSSVLRIVYKDAEKALNLPPTRISRAIDRIRASDNFEVKNLKEGLFIDISRLIAKVKEVYPKVTSETLAVSSSSLLLKTTTKELVASETLVWKSISLLDLRLVADLMAFYRYTKKDLSLKLIYALAQSYASNNKQLKSIALNLSYASSRATGSNSAKLSYLIKAIKEDWGGTTAPFEEMEKTMKVVLAYKAIREQNIADLATSDLRQMLCILGKITPDDETRERCLIYLDEVLKRSNELYEALSQLTGRSEDFDNRLLNPVTTEIL